MINVTQLLEEIDLILGAYTLALRMLIAEQGLYEIEEMQHLQDSYVKQLVDLKIEKHEEK